MTKPDSTPVSRDERLELRQRKCPHVWTHAFATVHNRLVSSTWCRKCKVTAFEFGRLQATEARQ